MENMFKKILRRAKEIKKTFLVNNVTLELKPVKTKQIINFADIGTFIDAPFYTYSAQPPRCNTESQ